MTDKTDRFIVKARRRESLVHHDMKWITEQIGPGYNCIDTSLVKEADIHIGLQEVRHVPPDCKPLAQAHKHDANEYYLIIGDVTIEITLGDEKHLVNGPTTVFVPAGMVHTLRPVKGSGYFVVVMKSKGYA